MVRVITRPSMGVPWSITNSQLSPGGTLVAIRTLSSSIKISLILINLIFLLHYHSLLSQRGKVGCVFLEYPYIDCLYQQILHNFEIFLHYYEFLQLYLIK